VLKPDADGSTERRCKGPSGCTIEEASQPLSKSWGSRLYATAIATLKRAMVRAGYGELFAPGALTTRSTFRGIVDAQPDA
jgi:hypothetical protein